MTTCGAVQEFKGTEQYDISDDGDAQVEHAEDIPTHKLYFSDLDGFSMLSCLVPDNVVTCVRDHYHRVIGFNQYFHQYPEAKYNQGKLKNEQHKLENAVRMLNGAETNMDNAKGPG